MRTLWRLLDLDTQSKKGICAINFYARFSIGKTFEGGRERETFSVVHVRASNLVHEQHEDETQHQGDADARVQLLVAVLVAAAGDHGLVGIRLCLRHFHGASVAMVVVVTCGKEHNVSAGRLIPCHSAAQRPTCVLAGVCCVRETHIGQMKFTVGRPSLCLRRVQCDHASIYSPL